VVSTNATFSCDNRAVAPAAVNLENGRRLVVGAATLASVFGTLTWHQHSEGPLTTYAGRSGLAAAVFVTTGLALAMAGWATSFTRPASRIGDLALVAGFLWFAPAWVGWDRGPGLIRDLAAVGAAFTFAVVVHLVLAIPSGRARPLAARVLVFAVYAEAGLAASITALFRDPFLDPGCWANCTKNVFLVRSQPRLVPVIQTTDRWLVAAAGAALAAICLWRVVTATGPARRSGLLVASSGVLLGAATVAHSIAVERVLAEDPADPAFFSIFLVGCAATILLAAGMGWAVIRARVQRRAVASLVTSLGAAPVPGSFGSALARAVGDPELRIAYWRPGSEEYVDADGRRVAEPVVRPGRALTVLERGSRRIAVVAHAVGVADLGREIGAAARLGLENERLHAEVLAELQDLRASRARIVETGDAERRRLERDLHDGAQQRLLALSYDIRVARAGAVSDGDPATATLLVRAVGEAQTALDELRELAHGIYPAVLASAGLAPALATFADQAPLPVDIRGTVETRFTTPVETAAYVVVVEAVEDAAGRGAGHVAVSAVQEAAHLVVIVEDDGSARESSMLQLGDRVGAVGGTVIVEPTKIRAVIPCA
jgi:signal transduction histidine kinase